MQNVLDTANVATFVATRFIRKASYGIPPQKRMLAVLVRMLLAAGRLPPHRSTGTDDKRNAISIALKYEETAREATAGRFIKSRARKIIADIYTLANSEVLPNSTTSFSLRRD
jgi:hypothetical protein